MTSAIRRWSFDIFTVIVLTMAVLFPATAYFAASSHACDGTNVVRIQLLTFIDNTVSRAVAATNATLASPTTTARQKLVAAKNLAELKAVQVDAHNRVHLSNCSVIGGL